MNLSNIKVNDIQVIGIDNELTAGSNNLIKNRGVYDKLYGISFSGNDLSNSGYVKYSTGTLEPAGYYTSDFIQVHEGQKITVTDFCSTSAAVLSAYSSNIESSYIQNDSINGDNTFQRIIDYSVPSGVNYIRFSCVSYGEYQYADNFYANIITDNTAEIPKLYNAINNISDSVFEQLNKEEYIILQISEIIETSLSDGYISSDGTDVYSSSYFNTNFILVNGGEVYDVPSVGNSNATTTVTFYIHNNKSSIVTDFTIYPPSDWSYKRKRFTIPFGINYIRVSFSLTVPEKERTILKLGNISIDASKVKDIEKSINKKDNSIELFDITKIRQGKAIYSNSPYNIIDYAANTIILTDYIDVKGLSWIEYSGIYGNGNPMFVRFTKTKDDNAAAADVKAYNINYSAGINSGSVYIGLISEEYRYMTITVCRVDSDATANSDNVSVKGILNNTYSQELIKYKNIAPKKACLAILMDVNGSSLNSQTTYDFVDLCKQYGLAPTFFPMSSDAGNHNLKKWIDEGCEIGIHTIPADGIGQTNPEPHPNESQFRNIVNGYIWSFVGNGINPIGWVTSQGLMVPSLVPFLTDYVGYAHTLANGGSIGDNNPSDFVNNHLTDRFKIKRWSIEQMNDGSDNLTEAKVISDAKTLIDNVVNANGMAILYTHSYNLYNGTSYTLRENVLKEILEHIKNWTRQGRLIIGTTADICNYYYC